MAPADLEEPAGGEFELLLGQPGRPRARLVTAFETAAHPENRRR